MQFWTQPYRDVDLPENDSIRIIEAKSNEEARLKASEEYGGEWYLPLAPIANGFKIRPDGMIVNRYGYAPHT